MPALQALTLTLLLSSVLSTLKLHNPAPLIKSFRARGSSSPRDIKYIVAHFGKTDYGMTLFGYAHFNKADPHGCKDESIKPFDKNDVQPFLVVRRGDCSFYQKARMAQKAGAKLIIVVDDRKESLDFKAVAPLVREASVVIPTIIVGQKDGEALISGIQQDGDAGKSVIMSFENPLKRKEKPELTVVVRADDNESYRFLGQFSEMTDSLNFAFTFVPFLSKCKDCSETVIKRDCYNGNTNACLFNMDEHYSSGDIIEASIAQYCFVQNLRNFKVFFDFASAYRSNCLKDIEKGQTLKDCTLDTAKTFESELYSSKFKDCYEYDSNTTNKNDSAYLSPLNQITDYLKRFKITASPIIGVNGKALDGAMTTSNVFDAICLGTTHPQKVCSYIEGKFKYISEVDKRIQANIVQERHEHYFMAFLVVACVAVGLFFFGKVFDRVFKRVMHEKVDDAVEQAISRYRNVGGDEDIEMN